MSNYSYTTDSSATISSTISTSSWSPSSNTYISTKAVEPKPRFRIDIPVMLKSGKYLPSENNPCIGSGYECIGIIIKRGDDGNVNVKWANGKINGYNTNDGYLTPVSKHTYKLKKKSSHCKSIW